MSRDLQVQGLTHSTIVLSSATNPTLFANAANVIKTDIAIATTTNSASLGTVFIAGGATFPTGASTAHMVECSNIAGLAYTVMGPAPFYIGVAGLTTTVQLMQSLSNVGGVTIR